MRCERGGDQHLNTDLARTRLLELRHVNNDEPAYMAQVETQFEQLQKHLAQAKKLYEPLIITNQSASYTPSFCTSVSAM